MKPIRLLLLVLAPSIAAAQLSPTGSPITGNTPPISFQSENGTQNVLLGTISAGAAMDTNNNNSTIDPIVGEQYFLNPSLAVQQTHGHMVWNMSYSPGLRVYVPSSSQPNQFSQLFGGTFRYDVTKRLTISLRQDYLRTNDPFQQLGTAPLQPGIGLLNQPATVALPDVRETSLLSEMLVNYHLAKHTSFGLSGDFTQMHYDDVIASNNTFINNRDISGSAYLSHQFTARQAVGIQYVYLNLVFPQGDSLTSTHGILLFDQIAINPRMSFSIFGGPEYSRIHNQEVLNLSFLTAQIPIQIPIAASVWSPAAGTTFSWSGNRTALQASFVRRVSNGGGLLGSVEMNDASLQIKKKLARRWVGSLNADMMQENLLDATREDLNILSTGAEIGRELAQNTWVRLSYQRMHGSGEYLSQAGFADHNRVTLTVQRNFNLPLGRQ